MPDPEPQLLCDGVSGQFLDNQKQCKGYCQLLKEKVMVVWFNALSVLILFLAGKTSLQWKTKNNFIYCVSKKDFAPNQTKQAPVDNRICGLKRESPQ